MNYPFINPPPKLPLYIRFALYMGKKITKKDMDIIKLLSWRKKSLFASGFLESSIVKNDKDVSNRTLQLVRIYISVLIGCSFCLALNKANYIDNKITLEEIIALEKDEIINNPLFTYRELAAFSYTKMVTSTPIIIDENIIENLKSNYSDREISLLGITISQVNYFARLQKGFGIIDSCNI